MAKRRSKASAIGYVSRISRLERVRAGDLEVHPRNWRVHPDTQRSALTLTLEAVGWADALVAREDGERLILIDGHLRRDLNPDAIVPVLIVNVSEEEAEVLLATLDPIAAMAGQSKEMLDELVERLLGHDTTIDAILSDVHLKDSRIKGRADPESVPEDVPKRAKKGDIWRLGDHVVACGDARDVTVYTALVAAVSRARVIVTDPPYGVSYESAGKRRRDSKDGMTRVRRKADMAGDESGSDLRGLLGVVIKLWQPSGDVYVFAPPGPQVLEMAKGITDAGVAVHQTLVWQKERFVPGRSNYHYAHEHILYGWAGRSSYRGKRTESTVWVHASMNVSKAHPTMKPVGVVERAIENSSRRGDVVADPFLGSGTTVIAAERLQRRAIGVEVSPRYMDVTLARWEAFVGGKAVKL